MFPLARFSVFAAIGTNEPYAVHANALDSIVGFGTLLTARYEWDFGDPLGDYNRLVGWNVAHVYDRPGMYNITLKLTNEKGLRSVCVQPIMIMGGGKTSYDFPARVESSQSILTPVKSFSHLDVAVA